MRNERFFMLNRIFLLFSMIFALAYPFIRIIVPVASQIEIPAVMQEGLTLPAFEVTTGNDSKIYMTDLLKFTYFTGVSALFILFLTKLTRIVSLIIRSEKIKKEDYYLIKTDRSGAPFSFFHYIVIPDNQYSESEIASIVMHERNHIRQFHTVDLMISEIFKALQWFNPVSWMYNKELQNIHEFAADKFVMSGGINRDEYLSLLIFNTNGCRSNGICNNFNILLTKKRIKMIMDTKTKTGAWLKVVPTVVLTVCLLAAHTSCIQQSDKQENVEAAKLEIPDDATFIVDGKEVKDISGIPPETIKSISVYKDKEMVREIADKYDVKAKSGLIDIKTKDYAKSEESATGDATPKTDKVSVQAEIITKTDKMTGNATPKTDNAGEVFTVVEHNPEFPGGTSALMKYLNDNVEYPRVAQENGIKGKVTLKFVITSTGEIRDVTILKGVDPSLDREAERVVKAMPKWIPGKQNGKPVSVWFTMPVTFTMN
jgi:TonB family protein